MNLTSGVFTATRPGTYFFSFTGVAEFSIFNSRSSVWFGVGLYLNEGQIVVNHVYEANTVANQWSPLTVQSTLNLKKDDRVWVQIDNWSEGARLAKSDDHTTHFTGFMLDEEIVESF